MEERHRERERERESKQTNKNKRNINRARERQKRNVTSWSNFDPLFKISTDDDDDLRWFENWFLWTALTYWRERNQNPSQSFVCLNFWKSFWGLRKSKKRTASESVRKIRSCDIPSHWVALIYKQIKAKWWNYTVGHFHIDLCWRDFLEPRQAGR